MTLHIEAEKYIGSSKSPGLRLYDADSERFLKVIQLPTDISTKVNQLLLLSPLGLRIPTLIIDILSGGVTVEAHQAKVGLVKKKIGKRKTNFYGLIFSILNDKK